MKKIGLANVVTHLHRNPGIDAKSHPELFNFCIDHKDQVNAHFEIEGMRLVYDLHLGVASVICLDEFQVAAYCQRESIEEFRPIYSPRSEDYYSSVLIIILRLRFESSLTNPASAWIDEEDLISEFEAYIAPQDRVNTAKTRDKVTKKLDALVRSQFVARQDMMGIARFSATKWLVLRLTTSAIEEMAARIGAFLIEARTNAGEDIAVTEHDEEGADLASALI